MLAPRRSPPLSLLLAGVAAACLPLRPASPQVISGRVLELGTEAPLQDVLVRLLFPDGRQAGQTVTDKKGEFALLLPRVGSYRLSAERIGLKTVTTEPLEVALNEEVEVVLRMAEEAIPLEPLVVEARAPAELGLLAGYFQRMERHRLEGWGYILSRDQIEERMALDVADLLRDIPRVRIVQQGRGEYPRVVFLGRGGECTPRVYVDGVYQNRGGAAGWAAVVDEIVRPYELEGVEVYRGIGEMPGEFYDDTHCGVILLWTKRDAQGGRPSTLRRLLTAFGVLIVFGYVVFR